MLIAREVAVLSPNPTTPEGAALNELLAAIQEIHDREGDLNGGEVVQFLEPWLTQFTAPPAGLSSSEAVDQAAVPNPHPVGHLHPDDRS